MTKSVHTPVLLSEVLAALAPKDGELFVDGTFGGGGYTQALLAAADCRVAALDRDTSAIAAGQSLQRRFADRLVLSHGVFSEMESLLAAQGIQAVDGVALDVGVSSDQIETPARGFSFMADGPLDMR
ncbi:MAG TPA: 16S rRNA (cytosine(1402)-N(4))-methyltransferase, partial [Alphaproteobacteria bacterium]|nr:16S rRNA (cytosine(1402)-N(4))-methyltransferase [Alphaproteobacteria bacterium]